MPVIHNRKQKKIYYTYTITEGQTEAWDLVFKDKENWKKVNERENQDFFYGSDNKNHGGETYFKKKYTKYFHRKHNFFNILSNNNVLCCPKTYTSYNTFLKNEQMNNKMWFLKMSSMDCGSGVVPFITNKKEIKKPIKYLDDDYYIIQKGIENLLLYKDRKFDCRVHALITGDGNVYIFKEAIIRISWKKFSQTCSCKKHQLTNGSLGVEAISSHDFALWKQCFPSVLKATREIMDVMLSYRDKKRYALIGLDFIFDKNNKAWVLEANTYPNLYYGPDPHLQQISTRMLSSLLDIVVLKKENSTLWTPVYCSKN